MNRLTYIFLSMILALGVVGCSKGSEIDTSKIEVTKEVREISVEKKQVAPNFELLDLKGKKKMLNDYKGSIVVLNFFNSLNMESIKEMPEFMKIGDFYRDKGVEVMYISPREKKEDIVQYVNENPISSLNILLDTKGDVEKKYGIDSIPTTYIIDREGHIFARLAKPISGKELEILVKSLL